MPPDSLLYRVLPYGRIKRLSEKKKEKKKTNGTKPMTAPLRIDHSSKALRQFHDSLDTHYLLVYNFSVVDGKIHLRIKLEDTFTLLSG